MQPLKLIAAAVVPLQKFATGSPVNRELPLARLSTRDTKLPMPTVSELKGHLNTPGPNECMFYTGGSQEEASEYAEENGLKMLSDFDKDNWALPRADGQDYADDCPMNWDFQEALAPSARWDSSDQPIYFDVLSEAYTELCSSTVMLGLTPGGGIPIDSVWARIEFPVIQ